LKHISVSKRHAVIDGFASKRVISDVGSQNGLIVNGKRVTRHELRDRDVIRITNSKLIFCNDMIRYTTSVIGESIEASGLFQIQQKKGALDFKAKKTIMNDVSLRIDPGELVAIVGGSGAGKSTLIYMLCGLRKPHKGQVSVSGIDLYKNFDSLKTRIGYVPQVDTVQKDLTLRDMLMFSAKLRIPEETSSDMNAHIDKALRDVDMKDHAEKYIKNLSGGQKKRASIAVELLADPKLFFLDEPGSGLDPFTEESLMGTLRKMADGGKTVVFVTHSPLSLRLCDKIVFIGAGGYLCYYGSYEQAIRFLCEEEVRRGEIADPRKFDPNNIVKVYAKTTNDAQKYSQKFNMGRSSSTIAGSAKGDKPPQKRSFIKQTGILFQRNVKLYINDSGKIRGSLILTALLAFFVSLVANGTQYDSYNMTKSLYFALTCAVFFVGCMNAITEVCKERSLIKREYMTTLSLGAYILAKTAVLLILCAVQSLIFAAFFAAGVGMPPDKLMFEPFLEVLLTIFLTGMAGSSMGMFVSCLSKNEDKAAKLAPLLLLPQMLFSGVIFELGNDILKAISYIVTSRWSMEAFGTFVNLNVMDAMMNGRRIPRTAEDMFEFTQKHAINSLIMIALFSVFFSVVSAFVLALIRNSDD
jgi:ABC-type multidrug transport system ATPase subunit